jgi:catechol-2,3-dioxygenase
MTMIRVTRLAHVGLNARDLSTQAEFYNDRWGLKRIDEFGGEMFFRSNGPSHHVLTLHSVDRPGLHHVAFEVPGVEDIDRAEEELAARGIEVVTPATSDLEPGIKKAVRFRDPDGFVVELVAGVDEVHEGPADPEVQLQGLNHVVLNVRSQDASEEFYRDLLGFKLTDRMIDSLSFWACNANHHSIAFVEARDGNPAFHHAAFELPDRDDWLRAIFFAGERGVPRTWGPGRHVFGNNLFSYYKDPEGNTVEYTTEVEQIGDPARQPRVEPPVPDSWKTVSR